MIKYFLYLTENFGERANYGGFENTSPMRDFLQMKKNITEIGKQRTESARKALESKYGARYTELIRLEYVDLIKFTIIDPMHNLFLGTAKTMLKKIWPEHDSVLEDELDTIQEVVSGSIVPQEIGKIPYKIASCFSSFTAEELKNWTLYYSPYALKPVLSKEAYTCWMLFVEACHILCQPTITIRGASLAHKYIMDFGREFERLYGSHRVMPNMHYHTHIVDCILDYGPVFGFWLFSFERYNGIMTSFPTNQKNVEVQLMRRFVRNTSWTDLSLPTDIDEIFGATFRRTFVAQPEEVKTVTLHQTVKQLIDLAHGPVTVGIDNYPSDNFVQLSGKKSDGILDDWEAGYFYTSLEICYPNINKTFLSPVYNDFSHVDVLGVSYGSEGSTKSRSSYVLAAWCGEDGQIDMSGLHLRPGQIEYFIYMHVPFTNEKERRPVVFAKTKWFKKHPQRNHYDSTSVSVWCRDLFEPNGPADFIPVLRLSGKFISGFTKIDRESVRVVIAQASRIYW